MNELRKLVIRDVVAADRDRLIEMFVSVVPAPSRNPIDTAGSGAWTTIAARVRPTMMNSGKRRWIVIRVFDAQSRSGRGRGGGPA
jgi:hypothetical protein